MTDPNLSATTTLADTPPLPEEPRDISQDTPDSSNISHYAYTKETQILTVRFRNGATWQYEDVPYQTVRALQHAPSAGKYFITNIRTSFQGTRVEDSKPSIV